MIARGQDYREGRYNWVWELLFVWLTAQTTADEERKTETTHRGRPKQHAHLERQKQYEHLEHPKQHTHFETSKTRIKAIAALYGDRRRRRILQASATGYLVEAYYHGCRHTNTLSGTDHMLVVCVRRRKEGREAGEARGGGGERGGKEARTAEQVFG